MECGADHFLNTGKFRLFFWNLLESDADHSHRAVPTDNEQCSAATHHLITNAVFNISTDVLILCVALPMFIKTQLPLRKKVAIVGIFSLGSFVILCAILNKFYSFTQPFGSEWTYWYVRESSTAILTANAPYLWALIRRVFHFRSLGSTSGQRYGYTQTYTGNNMPIQSRKASKSTHVQEMDMDDLLRADPELGDGGIHRAVEFHVTEDSRQASSRNSEKDGVSVSSTSHWAETWGDGMSGTRNHIEGPGLEFSDTQSTHQLPPKAMVRDRMSA